MKEICITEDLVWDTLNGLTAFIIPGPDVYSIAQGISAPEPGGVDAGLAELLMTTCHLSQPSSSPSPTAVAVAGLLNGLAQKINPSPSGEFASPFACLSFGEKAAVFSFLEKYPATAGSFELSALVLFVQTALAYSEMADFILQPSTPAEWHMGWAAWRHAGVC